MYSKKPKVLLGAHMPLSKGLASGIIDGAAIGCTAVQIFTKSNRQWNARPLTETIIKEFKEARRATNMGPVAAHATYLINLASPKPETAEKSRKGLELELKRCDELGIEYLVLHPGSHLKASTMEEGIDRIAAGLNTVFEAVKPKCVLLIETMAGQGTNIGHTFEQIAAIIDKVDEKKHIGVCLDTCHAFAAGYKFDTSARYKKFMEEFDAIIGIDKLKAIHLNNSKTMRGSRKDRHDHIATGQIPLQVFRYLLNDHRLIGIPKYIETPIDNPDDHEKNLKVLVGLLEEEQREYALNSALGKLFDLKEDPYTQKKQTENNKLK